MSYQSIAKLIPTLQSIALVSENLKLTKKKKVKTKDMIGIGTKNIVGISLIKIESDLIAGL